MKYLLHSSIACFIILLTLGCTSTERLLDEGNYDALIELAHRKLVGKKNKKEKYVRALESGFQKSIDRDMGRINRLKYSDRPDDWEKILTLVESIEHRQELLQPLLPLISREGYQASFQFVKTQDITNHAESRVVETLYDEGMAYLESARSGNKISAQRAYRAFDRIDNYISFFRDTESLRNEARLLGTVYVKVRVVNEMREWLPPYIASALEEPVLIEDGFWTRYIYDDQDQVQPDYEAQLLITEVAVGPESIHEEEILRKKKIEDGFDYVLDENGNVAKDSLGNDIRERRYVEVQAVVVKTHQEKIARLYGQVRIVDLVNDVLIDSEPINAEARFSHTGQSHYGDSRALRKDDKVVVGLVPFPGDDELILQAADGLKPVFARELHRANYL